MKYYKKKHFNKNKYFYSEMYGKTNISLPVYPKLNLKGLNYIIGTIKNFIKKMKKIALVGGCGFIGHNLRWISDFHDVVIIDSLGVNNLYAMIKIIL